MLRTFSDYEKRTRINLSTYIEDKTSNVVDVFFHAESYEVFIGEIIIGLGWSRGRYCGTLKFDVTLHNRLLDNDINNHNYNNITKITLINDSTALVDYPLYAGFIITNPFTTLYEKDPYYFGFRIYLLGYPTNSASEAYNTAFNLIVRSNSYKIYDKLKVVYQDLHYSFNPRLRKMQYGDIVDYYVSNANNINYPNTNLFDDNGLCRYRRVINNVIKSTSPEGRTSGFRGIVYENGVLEFNGYVNFNSYTDEVIITLIDAISGVNENYDLVASLLSSNGAPVGIRRISKNQFGVTSKSNGWVAVYGRYERQGFKGFDRDDYNHIPGQKPTKNILLTEKKLQNNTYILNKIYNSKHIFYSSFLYRSGVDKYDYRVA